MKKQLVPENARVEFSVIVNSSKYLMRRFYGEVDNPSHQIRPKIIGEFPIKVIKFQRGGLFESEKLIVPAHFELVPGRKYKLKIQFTEIPDDEKSST